MVLHGRLTLLGQRLVVQPLTEALVAYTGGGDSSPLGFGLDTSNRATLSLRPGKAHGDEAGSACITVSICLGDLGQLQELFKFRGLELVLVIQEA